MNHTRIRNSQKTAINAVSDPDAVSANTLSRTPDTQAILRESLHPDPKRDQETLLEHYIKLISALVLDVGAGRLRSESVHAADETLTSGVRLLGILQNARAAT